MTYPIQYGSVQRALLLASAMTIVMSQLDLSEEMLIFYQAIRGVTMCMILLIVGATLIIAFHQSELDADAALKAERQKPEKRKELPGTTMPKVAYSVWEEMGMHPSNALSTWKSKPRLFPFPLGKTKEGEGGSLYFGSGVAPQVGHVNKTEDKYSDRFNAAKKEVLAHNPEKVKQERLKAIRKYEYATRRKQWKRRFDHMKALCVLIMLSYMSQKAALAGLALLIWQVVNSELSRLLEKEPGDKMHEKYAARFGTYATSRRRPTGARSTKSEFSRRPDMGMGYLYQPGAGKNGTHLRQMPMVRPANSLLTSQNEEYSGSRAALWESEVAASGRGASSGMSSSGDFAGGSAGVEKLPQVGISQSGHDELTRLLGPARMAELKINEEDGQLDMSKLEFNEVQRLAGKP